MSDKLDIIYDIVKKIDSKQDKQSEKLHNLEMQGEKNTQDLADHIEGVKQNRKIIKHIDSRVEKLEEPKKFLQLGAKGLAWAAGVGVSLYGLYRGWLAIQGFLS